MKKTISILFLILTFIGCKAQTAPVIKSLDDLYSDNLTNVYYQDTRDEMSKFAGTWTFSGNNTSLIIKLQKKEMYCENSLCEDLIVGEYQYILNGAEIVNTLSNLTSSLVDGRNHNIAGQHIIPNPTLYVLCDDCQPDERRFLLDFTDPERSYLSLSIVLRYLPTGVGQPARITATLISNGGVIIPTENAPTSPRLPYGEYLLIKQ